MAQGEGLRCFHADARRLSYVAQDVPAAVSLGVPQPDGAVRGAGKEGAGGGASPPTSSAGSAPFRVHLKKTALGEGREVQLSPQTTSWLRASFHESNSARLSS